MSVKAVICVDGKTLKEIAKESGIPYTVVRGRYNIGKRTYEELTAPKKPSVIEPVIFVEGLTLPEICKKTGYSYDTVYHRWLRGAKTIEELTKPLRGAK